MSEATAVAEIRNSQHNGFTLVISEPEIWLFSLEAALARRNGIAAKLFDPCCAYFRIVY